jgi:hypothetical protein
MANILRVIPHTLEMNSSVMQQGRGLEVEGRGLEVEGVWRWKHSYVTFIGHKNKLCKFYGNKLIEKK